jgi:chromosome segregation ATPase
MKYLLFVILLWSALISAQESRTAVSNNNGYPQQEILDKIEQMRSQWAQNVADELSRLPEEIQCKVEEAQEKIKALEKEIQSLNTDSLSPQELQLKIKEIIRLKKDEADARIKIALQKIDEYKTGHKAQLDKAHDDIRNRIESKKAELESKRAEIEKKIANKKAEIENRKP